MQTPGQTQIPAGMQEVVTAYRKGPVLSDQATGCPGREQVRGHIQPPRLRPSLAAADGLLGPMPVFVATSCSSSSLAYYASNHGSLPRRGLHPELTVTRAQAQVA